LTITGYPTSEATLTASSSVSIASLLPGKTDLAARELVAQQTHGLGAGADELDVAVAADLGEVGVLGEEAVAGVDGVDVGDLGGGDDPVDPQIRLGGRSRPDADRPIGERQPRAVGVRLGVHAHRLHAQLAGGADDPQRYLTPVGDQDACKHAAARGLRRV
jgi:hypothetical protein